MEDQEKSSLSLNTIINLPESLKWYMLVNLSLLFIVLLFIFPKKFFILFLILDLFIWLCMVFYYKFISFSVTENAIIINYGMLIKHSKAIAFSKIQNIRSTKGPISSLFNLSKLTIWTSSPSQIIIRKGNSENRPELVLWIKTEDADWIKDFIAKKHS